MLYLKEIDSTQINTRPGNYIQIMFVHKLFFITISLIIYIWMQDLRGASEKDEGSQVDKENNDTLVSMNTSHQHQHGSEYSNINSLCV